MKAFGEAIARGILAMAGRRSPWGGGGKDGEPGSGSAGSDGNGDADEPSGEEPDSPAPDEPKGPRNPWLPPGDGPRRSANIEDIFRPRDQSRRGGGGGSGGGFPRLPPRPGGKSWFPVALGGIVLIWLAVTTTHMLGPKEQGIVTTVGKYTRTIGPGVSMTLPWPIQSVDTEEVFKINQFTIPKEDEQGERLMLTSDQALVNLSYLVRWKITDLKLYKFRLDDPQATIQQVAETAMRASVAEVPLKAVIGGIGRGEIEQNVARRMQAILNSYKAGVYIQGVQLKKADPPNAVAAAFQKVSAAQQEAQRYQNEAQAWAGQWIARAEGDAAQFDLVYGQYKLAPEVTRRRLYYETMERVLRNNDKVIIEATGVTPYLPLPEVRRREDPPETVVQGGH
jgi:membrane protease subunit HflK